MRAIFISYRRDDSEGQAGRLLKDLAGHFGQDAVFMDVAGIAPGRDFRRVIDEHVATCGVLLAVIGKAWITAQDASGRRRLDDPADFVRLETASALKRDIPVIPVLVHGAGMPEAGQLPPDLADLAFRNGVELSHARWDSDVQLLIKALEPYVQANRTDAGRDMGSTTSGPAVAALPAAALPSAALLSTALPAAAPPPTAGGGPAATQQPTKRSYLMIAGALAAAVAVALAAYLSSGDRHAAPPRIAEAAPKPGATADPDRKEVAKAADDAQIAAQAAAAAAAEDARLSAAKRDREALAAKEAADAKEAERLAAMKAADKREVDRLAALKRDREALAAKEAADGQEAERLAAKRAADKSEAERLAANRAAAEKVASERVAAEKVAAERVAAERAEKAVADKAAGEAAAEKLPQEQRTARQLAMGRVRWTSHDFPPPNGGATVFAIMPDGNPACASYNAASCLWGVSYEQLDFARLRPLVCGELHRARWGVTGYEDPKHWCNLARNVGSAGARVR